MKEKNNYSACISFCNKSRKRAACAPSICVWWNWNDTDSVVLNQPLRYLAPYHERVVEYTAIHPHCTINVVLHQCRCAYHHAVCQIMILSSFGNLAGKPEIVGVEYCQVIRERYVARTYFTSFIGNNGVYCDCIISYQFAGNHRILRCLLPPYRYTNTSAY